MSRARAGIAAWLGLGALCALPARADEVRIVSPQPDSVSITIYRDLFALVTETRTVDLPAGPVTLVFDGVVETLIPQSAVVADTGRATRESNYDFDRLTPARILEKSIGKKVTLTRTNPATGRTRQVQATLVSANRQGVIFQTADGAEALHCSGLPEQLTFDELPDDLHARASLSIPLAAGAAGKLQVRVSYIAHGFAWNADYVGNLAANAPEMELHGWLTLENLTSANFHAAQVAVVAGKLNLLDKENGGTSLIGDTAEFRDEDSLDEARNQVLEDAREYPEEFTDDLPNPVQYFRGCYPLQNTSYRRPKREAAGMVNAIVAEDIGLFRYSGEEMEEIVVVTGFRGSMAVRENLADYQLYRLPGATNLAARQTKQVAFLHAPAVKVDRFYALRLASDMEDTELGEDNYVPIDVKVGWRNRKADGLGEPLPGGTVRFFEAGPGGYSFVGEDHLKDTSVDTPVELELGKSVGLGVALDGEEAEPEVGFLSLLTRRTYLPINWRVINDKPLAVSVEIRQGPMSEYENWRVIGASLAPKRKAGDYLWRFEVPARGERTLTYKVGGRIPD